METPAEGEGLSIFDILEEAIVLEQDAVRRYRLGVDAAEDAETRALFEQLIRWEEGHETLLRERLATLRLIKGDEPED